MTIAILSSYIHVGAMHGLESIYIIADCSNLLTDVYMQERFFLFFSAAIISSHILAVKYLDIGHLVNVGYFW